MFSSRSWILLITRNFRPFLLVPRLTLVTLSGKQNEGSGVNDGFNLRSTACGFPSAIMYMSSVLFTWTVYWQHIKTCRGKMKRCFVLFPISMFIMPRGPIEHPSPSLSLSSLPKNCRCSRTPTIICTLSHVRKEMEISGWRKYLSLGYVIFRPNYWLN